MAGFDFYASPFYIPELCIGSETDKLGDVEFVGDG
jgi:hypothetical protein